MKTILCFGDSNTWGYDPASGQRHPYETRWPTILQRELGDHYRVIPEGLNGRTSTFDDPVDGDKNGREHLPMLLESHAPLDLVIIMLGTNDLKRRFSVPAVDIATGVGRLVDIVRVSGAGPDGSAPGVLVMVPGEIQRLTGFAEMFEGGTETSRKLAGAFSTMADERSVACVSIGSRARYSDDDGIHLDSDGHRAVGMLAAGQVRGLMEQ